MKKFLYLIVLLGFLAFPLNKAMAVNPAVMSLTPATYSSLVNSNFDIVIYFNANGNSVRGADVVINFDPRYLSVIDADNAISGIQVTPGTMFANVFINDVDNTNGIIKLSIGSFSAVTGDGTFGTIKFLAKAAVLSAVNTFNSVTVVTGVGGEIIPTTLNPGQYSVILEATATPTPKIAKGWNTAFGNGCTIYSAKQDNWKPVVLDFVSSVFPFSEIVKIFYLCR